MNNDFFHILDIRGLLLKRFHGEKQKNAPPTWQAGLDSFIKDVLLDQILVNGTAPRQVIAVWDAGNTHRLNLSADYKKRRLEEEKTPEQKAETKALFENAKRFLAYLGCKNVSVPGEEADDVVALLVEKLPGQKFVWTVDQDLVVLAKYQEVYVRRNGELFQSTSTFEGIPVRLISLKKSLLGDSSDGYLGVRGFGPSAWETLVGLGEPWLDWLETVIDTDNVEAMASVKDQHALLGKLYAQWSEWRIGWQLAKLAPEACYGAYRGKPKRPEWHVRIPSASVLRQVFAEITEYTAPEGLREEEIAKGMTRVEHWMPTERLIQASEYEELAGPIMAEIAKSPVCSYDFESSDKKQHACYRINDPKFVDVMSQELAGISVNYGDNLQHTIYVPFDHTDTGNFPLEWATWLLKALSELPDRPVVQNAAFEMVVAQNNLGYMPVAPYDTRIMRSYENENEEQGLKEMSKTVLNYRQASYAETTQGRMMCELTGAEVLSYGCDDSLVTSALFDVFRLQMQLEGSWAFYAANEVDPAVDDAWTFIAGTRLDLNRLSVLQAESAKRATTAESAIRQALETNLDPTDLERIRRGAMTLLKEAWETERFKYMDRLEDGQAAYAALWERCWRSCFYEPATVSESSVEFTPTPGNFAKVAGLIAPNAPKLTKTSVKAIEEYDGDMMVYLGSLPKNDPRDPVLREFMTLLYSARKYLTPAKRSGREFDALVQFCQAVFDEMLPKKVSKAGSELNFGSGPQMQAMLYGMLDLPVRRRSKPTEGSLRERERLPGSPATGLKAVASALVWDVTDPADWRMPVLNDYALVCKERQLESLYFGKYPNWVNPDTGRLHPSIRNCGTATRRPAGNSPNLLQVSKGDIRTMFPAGEGRVFVSSDFAGQEIVLTACTTQDPVLLDAFMQTPRKDVHALTASGIAWRILPRLGIPCSPGPMPYEDFLAGLHSEDPKIAKAYATVRGNKYAKPILFGLIYGASAISIAETLQIPKEEAEQLLDATFALYKRIPLWQDEVAARARKYGYVEMPFGSRRHATKDLWSGDRKLEGRQDRQLANAIIQSGAAEILKVVRQEMVNRKMRERYQLESIFPIYDEITASVPIELAENYCMELAEVMRVTPPGYPVGMEVDISIGRTWGDQIEIGIPTPEKIQKVLNQLESAK